MNDTAVAKYFDPKDKWNKQAWHTNEHECPTCKGHGKWKQKKGDLTAIACTTCWGFKYIDDPDQCEHEYHETKDLGNCLHEWACKKCKKEIKIDSSG